ncbi:MAG: lysine decarboxylase, partial [Bacteroidales bacterium]|nr:lysine decarboxylase [Bacteroidales bacterium]
MKDEPRSHPFRDSVEDVEAAKRIPDTPQTRAPAYRLAFTDRDFMTRDDLRPVRLQLELLKPQLIMDERGIDSTIVMFGAPASGAGNRQAAQTETLANLSHYYDEARRFARIMTERSLET